MQDLFSNPTSVNNNTSTSIRLRSLEIKNFKGIKYLLIDFDDKETNIFGDNATGKTTIFDSCRWLLFDKDSTNRKDFEIKPLDEKNNPLHGLETVVTGKFFISGKLVTLSKMFREKWQKKRGEVEKTFTGHETLYTVNDVPQLAGEYKITISQIINEDLFKMLTDPLYFGGPTMNWQERRKILLSIAENITDDEVLSTSAKLEALKPILDGKSVEDLRKTIAAKKRLLNDELKGIPIRISECNNSIVEVNVDEINKTLNLKIAELSKIDDELSGITTDNPELENIQKEISSKRAIMAKITDAAASDRRAEITRLKNAVATADSKVEDIDITLRAKKRTLTNNNAELNLLDEKVQKLRDDWKVEYAKSFTFTDSVECPTCKRKFDDAAIEQKKASLQSNFNETKANNLKKIDGDGKALAKQKNEFTELTEALKTEIVLLEGQLDDAKKNVSDAKIDLNNFECQVGMTDPKIVELQTEIEKLTQAIVPDNSKQLSNDLKVTKLNVKAEIDNLNKKLGLTETNEKLRERIQTLQSDERKKAQEFADLEKQEFLTETFIRSKVELLEKKINNLFQLVHFKLFNEQINGALEETCVPTINGVPFPDANNAAKYNAGIDIINALSRKFNVSAPIFIDNREGINELIATDAQIINLIVSKDKKLKVT